MQPMMLFAGYMSNLNSIVGWLRWIQYISPMRYSIEILFRNEYRRIDFLGNGDPLNPYPIEGFNFDIGMGLCFMSMLLVGLGFLVISFFFLKIQTINT